MDGHSNKQTRKSALRGKPVIDPAAWRAEDMAKRRDWLYQLSDAEIAELDSAIAGIEARGLDIKDITRDNFPLPGFANGLAKIRDDLTEGRGFVLIRGLPIERMSDWQAGAAFYGMGTYLGRALSQNPEGHVLGHVKDLGKDYGDPMVRGYQTGARMAFHSDQCDFVALLCLRPSKSGGESLLAPSLTLYNEMLKRRPDLADILGNEFYLTRHGEVPPGEEPWYKQAIFSFNEGYLTIRGAGAHVRKSQSLPGVPKFTEADEEALTLFQQLADEVSMPMSFEPGDIQILMNHVMLHTRTAFEDWPEPERKRHLMRLWLSDPTCRPIPDRFRENISGIELEGTVLTAPLDMD
jgi:hypothetical protein